MTAFSRTTVTLGLTVCVSLLSSSGVIAESPAADDSVSPATASVIATPDSPSTRPPAVPIYDVALTEDGVVRGRLLSGDGKPVDGAQVVIRQGDELMRKTVTNKQGQFEADGLRAGVYTISTIHGSGLYRLWPKNIAPPSARTHALVVTQKPVMRAQFGGPDLATWTALGVGAAGLTFGIISYDKVKDLEDDVKALKSP